MDRQTFWLISFPSLFYWRVNMKSVQLSILHVYTFVFQLYSSSPLQGLSDSPGIWSQLWASVFLSQEEPRSASRSGVSFIPPLHWRRRRVVTWPRRDKVTVTSRGRRTPEWWMCVVHSLIHYALLTMCVLLYQHHTPFLKLYHNPVFLHTDPSQYQKIIQYTILD